MSRLTINSNIASLNAQRHLNLATGKLSESFNRLSSGLRINKASDDAAGLAVASLLNIDKRVASQGIRNLNDGTSYLNVAEGALNELSNILLRIGEVAEQSANGTLGSSQRNALQQEVTALTNEYNRIIDSTKFNDKQILAGSGTNTILQGGYGVAGQLEIQIGDESIEGETTRVNLNSSGGQISGASDLQDMSSDGRYIVFGSSPNVYVRDTLLGTTVTATVTSSGGANTSSSSQGSISADGRYVAFQASGTNLVTGDTNGVADIFVRDLQLGTTTRVSVLSDESESNGNSNNPTISADGRFVTFSSNATNLVAGDTNGVTDIFVRDLLLGTTTRVSVSDSETEGNGLSTDSDISADGRYVTFKSSASNLTIGDVNGTSDIFVRDLVLGTTTIVSVSSSGTQGSAGVDGPSISADGRYIAFEGASPNLVAGDTNAKGDIFLRDTLLGVTTKVSLSDTEAQTNQNSYGASISADGTSVAFYSDATNLVTGDTNGVRDVFVRNIAKGTTIRASTNSLGAEANGASSAGTGIFIGISSDGSSVAFQSDATNLISNDTNGAQDVFIKQLSQSGVQKLSALSVSTQSAAKSTLSTTRQSQNEINLYRSNIGAYSSRIETFINTLRTTESNYTSAVSQILDADIAEESSKLTSNKIIQQSASAILTQANQQPRVVLKLLEGL